MTRTTGATAKQVSDAALLCFKNPNLTQHDYAEYAEWAMERTMDVAVALVPPDQRIVAVADLRSVMELAMTSAWAADNYEIIDRITALIGDEA